MRLNDIRIILLGPFFSGHICDCQCMEQIFQMIWISHLLGRYKDRINRLPVFVCLANFSLFFTLFSFLLYVISLGSRAVTQLLGGIIVVYILFCFVQDDAAAIGCRET